MLTKLLCVEGRYVQIVSPTNARQIPKSFSFEMEFFLSELSGGSSGLGTAVGGWLIFECVSTYEDFKSLARLKLIEHF